MAYVSTETTRRVRGELKQRFPNLKFSVSKNDGTLRVRIMAGDLDFRDIWEDIPDNKQYWKRYGNPKPHFDGYVSINTYHPDDYNPKYTDLFKQIISIMKGTEWFDNSDPQIDYFSTAYYLKLSVGKWNKPYQYTGTPRMDDIFRRFRGEEDEHIHKYEPMRDEKDYMICRGCDGILHKELVEYLYQQCPRCDCAYCNPMGLSEGERAKERMKVIMSYYDAGLMPYPPKNRANAEEFEAPKGCSLCGVSGHNRRTCPNRGINPFKIGDTLIRKREPKSERGRGKPFRVGDLGRYTKKKGQYQVQHDSGFTTIFPTIDDLKYFFEPYRPNTSSHGFAPLFRRQTERAYLRRFGKIQSQNTQDYPIYSMTLGAEGEEFEAPKPQLTKNQMKLLNHIKVSAFHGGGRDAYVKTDRKGWDGFKPQLVQKLLDKGIITIPKHYGRIESLKAYTVMLNPIAWEYPFKYDWDKSLKQKGNKIVRNKRIHREETARKLEEQRRRDNMTFDEVYAELFGAEYVGYNLYDDSGYPHISKRTMKGWDITKYDLYGGDWFIYDLRKGDNYIRVQKTPRKRNRRGIPYEGYNPTIARKEELKKIGEEEGKLYRKKSAILNNLAPYEWKNNPNMGRSAYSERTYFSSLSSVLDWLDNEISQGATFDDTDNYNKPDPYAYGAEEFGAEGEDNTGKPYIESPTWVLINNVLSQNGYDDLDDLPEKLKVLLFDVFNKGAEFGLQYSFITREMRKNRYNAEGEDMNLLNTYFDEEVYRLSPDIYAEVYDRIDYDNYLLNSKPSFQNRMKQFQNRVKRMDENIYQRAMEKAQMMVAKNEEDFEAEGEDMTLKDSAKLGFGLGAGLLGFRVALFGASALVGGLLLNRK